MNIQTFDFSLNLLRALLWQFNDAARLQKLLEGKQAWYDANYSQFWSDWVRDVFDLRTANDFGLQVWAVILGLPLTVVPGDDPDKPIFGFAADDENFTNGNFAASGAIGLSTEQKRIVLRLRYFQLIGRHSVPQAHRFLADVFGPGWGYINDTLDMTVRYVFTITLGPQLEFVLKEYALLPRPAGVFADYVVLSSADAWGFGPFRENFDNGNFYHA